VPVDSQFYQAEQAAGGPASRDAEGRWRKGASGNPAGRPRGSRNQATRMAEMLLDAAAEALTGKAIERALAGDDVALRFCLARIVAPRRAPAVELDLPPLDTRKDLALAMAAVGEAAAQGTIAPAEALDLARVVDTAIRAIEARDAEHRENRFWGRERSPAAPPLRRPDPPPEPERAGGAGRSAGKLQQHLRPAAPPTT
jgi:hypothetical protein